MEFGVAIFSPRDAIKPGGVARLAEERGQALDAWESAIAEFTGEGEV